MQLRTLIQELNAREMHRYRTRMPNRHRLIEKRDPDHGWVFVCWAEPSDVRGLLEGMGDEYEPLIERLDHEGLGL